MSDIRLARMTGIETCGIGDPSSGFMSFTGTSVRFLILGINTQRTQQSTPNLEEILSDDKLHIGIRSKQTRQPW